jgi:hypothetical protein
MNPNKKETTYIPDKVSLGRLRWGQKKQAQIEFNVGDPLMRELVSCAWVEQPRWASKLVVEKNVHYLFPIIIKFIVDTTSEEPPQAGEDSPIKESLVIVLDNDQTFYIPVEAQITRRETTKVISKQMKEKLILFWVVLGSAVAVFFDKRDVKEQEIVFILWILVGCLIYFGQKKVRSAQNTELQVDVTQPESLNDASQQNMD